MTDECIILIHLMTKRKWYNYLNNEKKDDYLEKDHPTSTLKTKLVVSHSSLVGPVAELKQLRRYTIFNDYLEYADYVKTIAESVRSFYEVIYGSFSQKPHFDLDIKATLVQPDEVEQILDAVLDAINAQFQAWQITLQPSRDIIICSGHDANKYSFHLIIDNYCHENNLEAKEFYQQVKARIPEKWQSFVDGKVYSPRQCFRLLGSYKEGTSRLKIFQECWHWHEKEYHYEYPGAGDKFKMQLSATLVSYTARCKILSRLLPEDRKTEFRDTIELSTEMVKDAIALSRHTMGKYWNFSYADTRGGMILLKRDGPSYCPLCKRIHDHQNPYLLVVPSTRMVYWLCRQGEGRLAMGYMDSIFQAELNEEVESPRDSHETTPKAAAPSVQIKHELGLSLKELQDYAHQSYKQSRSSATNRYADVFRETSELID